MLWKPVLASVGSGVDVPGSALRSGTWNRVSSVGLSLLVALLPKCSVCLMVHGSILAAMGLMTVPQLPRPVVVVSLLGAVGLLARGAPTRRGYRPAAVGSVAALLLLADLTHSHGAHAGHAMTAGAHHPILTWAGSALLVAASVWNAWPSRRNGPASGHCAPCGAPASPCTE